jgi:ribosomal protein S18 acetylase RimI-like enzyme
VEGHANVLSYSPVHNVRSGVVYPPCLLLPALNDARTGFWESLKFAHAVRSNDHPTEERQEVFVRTDMDGGHFRSADPAKRRSLRALEYGFVLHHCRRATQPRTGSRSRTSKMCMCAGEEDVTALLYRLATPSDFGAIGALRTLIFSPHLTAVGSRYLQTRKYADALEDKVAVIVAETAGRNIVGAADLAAVTSKVDENAAGATVGYVTNVCVHPGAQRRGIGVRLVVELEELAARRGVQVLALHVDNDNVAAIGLYRARSFSDVCDDALLLASVARFVEKAGEQPQLLMTKLLPALDAEQERDSQMEEEEAEEEEEEEEEGEPWHDLLQWAAASEYLGRDTDGGLEREP